MAITRAQIARELYIKGGVVNPDGRRGFGGGADFGQVADSKGKSNKGLSGPSKGGYQGGPKGGYGDAGNKGSTYSSEVEDEIYQTGEEDRKEIQKIIDQQKKEEDKKVRDRQKKKYEKSFTSQGFVPPGADRKKRQRALDYVNRGLSRYLDRFEEYYDEDEFGITKTGYPNFGFPNIYDAIGDELTARKNIKEIKKTGNKIPVGTSGNSYELSAIPDLDVDSIRELAATQTLAQGAPLTGYQANALEDLKRNIENRDTFLETGDTSVIYPDLPEATNTGPDPDPVDPCLGPNPPAYCAVNNDPADPATPSRNLGGLAPRFAGSIFDFTDLADGGRAGAMDGGRMMMMANEEEDDPTGGIMDLESGRQMYFLGKLVKKASKAIKKVVKSPIGKAALIGGLGYLGATKMGGMKGLTKFFGANSFNPFKTGIPGVGKVSSPFGALASKFGITDLITGNLTGLGKGALIGLPSILPLLMGQKEEDDKFNIDDYYKTNSLNIADIRNNPYNFLSARNQGSMYAADGGLMRNGYQEGGDAEPVAKKTMPLLDMDGQEMDLREEGGFVPLGRMERADDVPARLSKNEFVFTADAVRNAGEGDVDKGAEVMYNMMKNLESGGEVSEESQGLDGAREMFKTSQRLEEVI
jgi:hypothetical protein